MIVIGVDPDSKAHGIAVFHDGKLIELAQWNLLTIMQKFMIPTPVTGIHFSIEDVVSQKFVYRRNQRESKFAQAEQARCVGLCQQAQVELVRMLDHFGIPYTLHKPQRGNWAEDSDMFIRLTGWEKRSNKDTRSAAYFGFLEKDRSK